jgi:tetratricopeptide (TPR) repeat protein
MTKILLICHKTHPNLILRTSVVATENILESMSRFSQRGTRSNEEVIQKMWSAGVAAYEDFNSYGNLQSLEQAISTFEAIAGMTPENDLSLPSILDSLGSSLHCRFEQLGVVADINNAIELLEMSVGLTPDRDPEKPGRLGNLAGSLSSRFQQDGNVLHLDRAITQLQSAIYLISDEHPDKFMCLSNLGSCLYGRFERLGNLLDLDSAITQQQSAIDLTSDGNPDKSICLNNLGISLQKRFGRLGNISDLDSAIIQLQSAINLTPDKNPLKPGRLNNLANSLQTRFEHLRNLSDIDSAITQLQSAINLTPDGHPDKPGWLTSLGNCLHSRFERLGNIADLDSAIIQHQLAIDFTPDGHPNKPIFLNNIGNPLVRRFQRLGNLSDLDSAIDQRQSAVNFTPDGHPAKPDYLWSLGSAFATRFLNFRCAHDAEAAITYMSTSAQSPVGSPTIRLMAAQKWISIATLISHHSLLSAYECAVSLMPVVAWLGLPVRDRHKHLVQTSEIARDAAAAAISFEQYDKALEWLEQGRSIVWNQILQLRTPVDELREVNSDLSDRLLRISRILDHGVEEKGTQKFAEQNSQRYRALTIEWESILHEIRALPTFENFLKPLRASRLRNAAQNGPVVVVNIAEKRCDALALVPGIEEVIHIALPNITSKRVKELRYELKDHLYSNGIRMRGERAAQKWTDHRDSNDCTDILAELWNGLVKPVLESLAFSVGFISPLYLAY